MVFTTVAGQGTITISPLFTLNNVILHLTNLKQRKNFSIYCFVCSCITWLCFITRDNKFWIFTFANGARTTQHFLTWFGSCGQVQTGSFIDIAAPNGLFGLGFEKVSVPSILFREGYIDNSFSMCFGRDGTGRLNFGDKGSLDQEETPFNMNSFQSVRISLIFTLHIVVCSYPWYRADTSTFCFL